LLPFYQENYRKFLSFLRQYIPRITVLQST
jgi:hypothetical protein